VIKDEAAFYGPKIDMKLLDALGRKWQLSTVQFDFTLPQRVGLECVAEDGKRHRPLMVHRALYGSVERFFGILIEHYAGAFPVWLAPVQAVVLPITDRHLEYPRTVPERLEAEGFRMSAALPSRDRSHRGGTTGRQSRHRGVGAGVVGLVGGVAHPPERKTPPNGHPAARWEQKGQALALHGVSAPPSRP
jgi:hypothetical protein